MHLVRNSILILFISCSFINDVKSQDVLIPYRIGDNWGMSDTNRNIVITPQYDTILSEHYYAAGHYVAKAKNGKWTVITKEKEVIPPILSEVRFNRNKDFIVDGGSIGSTTVGKSRDIYYTLEGKKLFNDSIRQMREIKNSNVFNVWFSNDSSMLFKMDSLHRNIIDTIIYDKGQIITMANRLYFYNDGMKKAFNMSFDSSGKFSLKSRPLKTVSDDETELMMDMPAERMPREIMPVLTVELNDREYYFIKKRRTRYYNGNDTIKSGKIPSKNFSMSEFSEFLLSYSSYNNGKKDKETPNEQFIVYKKKRRYGIITSDSILPPIFDEVFGYKYLNFRRKFFKVRVKNKYGIINTRGKWLMECEYDSIDLNSSNGKHFVVTKNKLKGVYTMDYYRGNVNESIKVNYDKLEYLGMAFSVIKDGRYGYWYYHKMDIEPIFKYKVNHFEYFGKYKVWSLYDKQDKFLGFGNSKGELFFKEEN